MAGSPRGAVERLQAVGENVRARLRLSIIPIFWLFTISGATGLIYEILWRRSLMLVLGGSMWATAIVLSAFMAGLGLGAIVIGRLGDRLENPLRWYGLAEMAIGAYALLFPLICRLLRLAHDGAFLMLEARPLWFRSSALSATFLVLLPPTLLMGGTFPLLVRHCLRLRRSVGRGVRDLYLFNTMGAVAGTILAGFFLIRLWGMAATAIVTAILNLAVGAVAVWLARAWKGQANLTALGGPVKRRKPKAAPPVADDRVPGALSPPRIWLVLIVFAFSGLTALSYETLWARIMVFVLGNSTYAFAVMLSSVLLGLAVGAWLAEFAGEKRTIAKVAVIEGLIAVSAVATLFITPGLHNLRSFLFDTLSRVGCGGLLVSYYVLVLLVLLPTATLFGIAFPLLVRACTLGNNRAGGDVGRAYGSNTLGAILGPLAAMMVFIPRWGLGGAVVATAVLNLSLCIALLAIEPEWPWRRKAGGACVAGIVAAILLVAGPRQVALTRFCSLLPGKPLPLLYYREEPTATVAVFQLPDNLAKVLEIDGVSQVPTDADSMQAFRLLGHLPFLVRDDVRTVLVTAFGGAITIGTIFTHPVKRVDAVEICPAVLPAARVFGEENYEALSDPRLRIILNDAGSYVRATPNRYDAIVSDATHPGAAESWVLYTREFYENCKARLEPDGVMCQWLPLHGLSSDDFRTVLRTFQSVYPHATLWFARGHTVLLATERPLVLDAQRIRRVLDDPKAGPSLKSAYLNTPLAVLKNLALTEANMALLAQGVPLATENRTPLEFAGWRAHRQATVGLNCQAIGSACEGFVLVAALLDSEKAALSGMIAARPKYYQAVGLWCDGHVQAALPLFRAAAESMPPDDDTGKHAIALMEWYLQQMTQNPDLAEHLDDLRALARLLPTEPLVQVRLGQILVASQKQKRDSNLLKEGLDLLRHTADRYPDRPDVQIGAAYEFARLQQYGLAQLFLERAVQRQPNNALAWSNLAYAHWKQGHRDQCRQAVERALSIQPDLGQARAILRQIEKGP